MKNILGHNSWNEQELVEILKRGTYTMPNLPHYRYSRVQSFCADMRTLGLIKKTGACETGINYIPTEKFQAFTESGLTLRAYAKMIKKLTPPRIFKRKCRECGSEFETLQHIQKLCGEECRAMERRRKYAAQLEKVLNQLTPPLRGEE